MRALDLTVRRVREAPERYCFFAVGQNVCFGDQEEVRRINEEGFEPLRTHYWSLTGGDFEDETTATLIARLLNSGLETERRAKKVDLDDVHGFIAQMTVLKIEAGRRNLWKTYHKLDEATSAVGWEVADKIQKAKCGR